MIIFLLIVGIYGQGWESNPPEVTTYLNKVACVSSASAINAEADNTKSDFKLGMRWAKVYEINLSKHTVVEISVPQIPILEDK